MVFQAKRDGFWKREMVSFAILHHHHRRRHQVIIDGQETSSLILQRKKQRFARIATSGKVSDKHWRFAIATRKRSFCDITLESGWLRGASHFVSSNFQHQKCRPSSARLFHWALTGRRRSCSTRRCARILVLRTRRARGGGVLEIAVWTGV